MRQIVAVFLSLSVALPDSLFAYDYYFRYERGVVQTYNFKTPTNLIGNLSFQSPGFQSTKGTFVPSITQQKPPIGFFSGVASAVKAIPAFISTVASKIGEAASFLWNRVVLGHRTENTATLGAFADPDNNLIIRSGGLVLATAMVVPKTVEETVAFVVDCVHPAREFVVHSFLVAHEKDPVEKLRAAGKAADNFGEFFIRAEPGATMGVQTTRSVAIEAFSFGRQIVDWVGRKGSELMRPVLGDAGHLLNPFAPKLLITNVEIRSFGKIILKGDVDIAPTLLRIKDRVKFPHGNDGAIFMNRNNPLPIKPEGYYREYVHPTPGIQGPGPQRIIIGSRGEVYYSPDHYATFTKVLIDILK